MRNIFILLWKYQFSIVFLLLEGVCVFLIVQNNNYHNASFVHSANTFTARILESVNEVREYVNLKEVNERLADENAHLLEKLPESFYIGSNDTTYVVDSVYHQQYSYIKAKVVNNTTNRRNNYLTLNRGSIHGIRPETGVITGSGVVGIVKDVSEHYCTVISLLHKESRISASIKRSGFYGSLIWDGSNPGQADLLEIPKNAEYRIGDTIVTTSFSSLFPEGLVIGTVYKGSIKPGDNFHDIRVKLSTNFSNVSWVYIVTNMHKEERKKLEGGLNDQ